MRKLEVVMSIALKSLITTVKVKFDLIKFAKTGAEI